MSSLLSNSPGSRSRTFAAALAVAAFASVLAAGFATPAFAQAAPADDPYGIGTSPSAPGVPDTGTTVTPATPTPPPPPPAPPTIIPPDTARTAAGDTLQTGRAAPDTAAPRAPRPRITRETTVNPMDMKRGTYRNPKKALFMSLIVPGLGQAYIGQTKFNYIRAALYFSAEVTMGYLWYDYSVVKYDKKVKQYRNFADQHWSQPAYEGKITELVGTVTDELYFERFNPSRISYCTAVQSRASQGGENQYKGCVEPYSEDQSTNYSAFVNSVAGDSPGAVAGARRNGFPNDVAFYEMIGRDIEFVYGWDDVLADPGQPTGYNLSDSSWAASSANRDSYNGMRQQAKDYSRMQTWFLGGIVLNHIASAVDAAITARRHNRILYEDGGARWFDKVNLDGGMAMDLGRPRTYMMAHLSF